MKLTTPGSNCSASILGPSPGCGVAGGDESDDESGDDGTLPLADPNFTVNIWEKSYNYIKDSLIKVTTT